jgi:hypothetical protein
MNEERERVLKLLEEKKISAAEASRLLDALAESPRPGNAKFLKVRVYDRVSGKSKVNVVVPVSLVRWGLQFVPESAQLKLNQHHIDFERVADALEHDFAGKLVDVDNEEEGERVEVYLE